MKNRKYISGFAIAAAVAVGSLSFGSPAHASFTLLNSNDLTVGSTGQNVVQLQAILSELGYLEVPMGIPFGRFGSLTRNALSRYQMAFGIIPSVGYFGPKTRAQMEVYLNSRGWLNMLYAYYY